MAITYVTSSAAGLEASAGSATIAVTLGAAVAIDDIIVGMTGWDTTNGSVIGVVDNLGNSYTVHSDQIDDAGNSQAGSTWHSKVTVAGTPTITTNFSPSASGRRTIAAAWSGSKASPFDTSKGNFQNAPGTGTDAVTSTAITTAEDNELLVGLNQRTSAAVGTITAGSAYTSRLTVSSTVAIEDRILITAGSIAATFTFSADHRTITHIVAIKAISGAGGNPVVLQAINTLAKLTVA